MCLVFLKHVFWYLRSQVFLITFLIMKLWVWIILKLISAWMNASSLTMNSLWIKHNQLVCLYIPQTLNHRVKSYLQKKSLFKMIKISLTWLIYLQSNISYQNTLNRYLMTKNINNALKSVNMNHASNS